jgi:hypothetical protein
LDIAYDFLGAECIYWLRHTANQATLLIDVEWESRDELYGNTCKLPEDGMGCFMVCH